MVVENCESECTCVPFTLGREREAIKSDRGRRKGPKNKKRIVAVYTRVRERVRRLMGELCLRNTLKRTTSTETALLVPNDRVVAAHTTFFCSERASSDHFQPERAESAERPMSEYLGVKPTLICLCSTGDTHTHTHTHTHSDTQLSDTHTAQWPRRPETTRRR